MSRKGNFLKATLSIAVFTLLSASLIEGVSVAPETEHEDPPYMDEIYFYTVFPESSILPMITDGLLDTAIDLKDPSIITEIESLGWNISINPSFHMCYLGINCRNVTPASSGKYANYHNRVPGFELYPLNISTFRWALHLLVGDQKDAWIDELYGFIIERQDSYVPAANKFWHNPDVPPVPYDPQEAYNILTAAGFSNTSGYWMCPNGEEMRQIYILEPAVPPGTVTIAEKCVESWNKFFGKMSDGVNYYFQIDRMSSVATMIKIIFYNRDFDIYFLCWGLKREPDYLYDFFHSATDMEGGDNSPGLDYSPLNRLLYMLKYTKDPDTHEMITDINEIRQICFEAQWHLHNQTPCIPLYSRKSINAYRPELTNWTESSGYGSAPSNIEMPWTYLNIRWKNQTFGGSINCHVNGLVTTLNPGTANLAYEWTILSRIFDSLMVADPDTHEDLPWAATKWKIEPYINETEGVANGMKITFSLRNDVYWHDGDPVTADDCVWNFEFIKSVGFSKLVTVWCNYIKSKMVDSYTFTVYVNTTALWEVYDYARNTLLFPRQIWEPYWGNKTAAENFHPWEIPHPLFEGPPSEWPQWWPYNWPLTQLVGCGPYIFHEWNKTASPQYVHVARSPFWPPPKVIGDVNRDFKNDVEDLVLIVKAFGSYPGHPRWNLDADVNSDGKIDIQDLVLLIKHFGEHYP